MGLLDDYNKLLEQKKTATPEIENESIQEKAMDENQNEKEKGYNISTNFADGDPEKQKANQNQAYALNQFADQASLKNQRELYADPESWGPEFTAMGFVEESAKSIARGLGRYVVKGTGDMIQIASGIAGGDIAEGNWLSKMLQDAGTDIENNNKAFIPEELQAENITWSSMFDPKFWSIQIAEQIPQIAEFILLSKGGSAIANKVAGGVLKNLPGAARTALGKEIFGTGSGIIGKLATDQGLKFAGKQLFGAMGGGIAGNLFSGLMNAAELVNSNKDLVDENGNKLFTEEELSQMAMGTMRHNANYLLYDMASWGMTFGGGWKALKGLNPISKGSKLYTAAQQSKIVSNLFRYDIAPMVKSMARIGGIAMTEGIEETFQETYEDWAKMKAKSDVTGEPMKYKNYWDFYNSKENKATKVISFAMGALSGGGFNLPEAMNKTAEANYRLHDAIKNFSEITKKQGTEDELTYQTFAIRDTMANIVADDNVENKTELFDQFLTKLVKNENINEEEELPMLQDMFSEFMQAKEKATRLNVKGKKAYMHAIASEMNVDSKIAEYKAIAEEKIQTINETETYTDEQKNEYIKEAEDLFQERLKALSILKAQAKQNQSNLIIGKKARPFDLNIVLDEYGNEMVIGGLSTEQYDDYVDDKYKTVKELEEAAEKKNSSFTIPSMNNLSTKAKEYARKIMDSFKAPTEENQNSEVDIENEIDNQQNEENQLTEEEATQQANQSMANSQVDNETDPDPISDEVFDAFQEGEVFEPTIQAIAEKIQSETALSPREDEIRRSNEEPIRKQIVKNLLGTNKNDSQENQEKEKADDKPDNKDSKKEKTDTKKENNEPKAKPEKDPELSSKENEFVDEMVNDENIPTQTTEDVKKKNEKDALDKFSPDLNKTKDAKDQINFDKRSAEEEKVFRKIQKQNIIDYAIGLAFKNKLRTQKVTEGEFVSQNEIDNFLNRYTSYNEFGPTDLDRMITVNHFLKRMFPGTNDPTQAIIVRNLFESIGSKGVGTTIANTIFIDTKAWAQDKVFMHEMAHVYYALAENEEEVQDILKKAMLNPELVREIKSKYDDYTLYRINNGDGTYTEMTKGQIQEAFGATEDMNEFEDFFSSMLENGNIETVPLSKQKYLKNEMFAAMLEGPLSNTFDKVFSPKNEPTRQAVVKKFWGLIHKKGEILNENDNVLKLLSKLDENDDMGNKDPHQFIMDTFKTVTKGTKFDLFGLDARAKKAMDEKSKAYDEIGQRKKRKINNVPEEFEDDFYDEIDREDGYENGLETDGEAFFNKDFDSKIKKATRILKRFGIVYNKMVRAKELKETKGQFIDRKKATREKLFDRTFFEAAIYNLAIENEKPNAFIWQIENSNIKEIQAFNKFLNKIHPDTKEQLLNSMHFVMSNAKHVVGFRNTLDAKGNHQMVDSLSHRELNIVNNIVNSLKHARDGQHEKWKGFEESVQNIFQGKESADDYRIVLKALTNGTIDLARLIEQGVITFKGRSIPIETLLAGFIKQGRLFNKNEKNLFDPTKGVYYGRTRPLVEAIVNTNRKFTPFATVKNAEGNMEPVRIVNNNLTKEIDNMISFLSGQNGKVPTKEEFLDRFSHITNKSKDELGKTYVPNQFLEHIYDDYQKGMLPTISQYHGIEHISTPQNSSILKNSSAVEQFMENFLTFTSTSRTPSGKKNATFLNDLGVFADSPRKYMMNMKRIDFNDVFKSLKLDFVQDGKIINSIFNIHNNLYNDELTNNKTKFRKQIIESIKETVNLFEQNKDAFKNVQNMSIYFDYKGNINRDGKILIVEFTLNNIIHGYNVAETFLPGVDPKEFAKRFKMNSSPVFSIKNPDFKIEPIPFAEDIINNSIAGDDSGMYITEESAKKIQALGKGVFDMNGGFKFLNGSIEKDNPLFKDKSAYLKGYTTIVKKGDKLYDILKAREDKFKEWHISKFGTEPNFDLTEGHNHMAIAIPMSSDKSNFFPDSFIQKNENEDLEYTDLGMKFTKDALLANPEEAMKYYDKLFYTQKGNFRGISAYNFGPQQVMDKVTERANMPVQMINSVIVNASLNGQLELAEKIQELISNQKQKEFQRRLKKIESGSIDDYKSSIEGDMNKEAMDQGQRILLEDNGSIAHPYNVEIVTNQLAKTLRRAGNKLSTPGTYAHQKPDKGFGSTNKKLRSYRKNSNGSLQAAEIILPQHMSEKVFKRQPITFNNKWGTQAIKKGSEGLSKSDKARMEELRKTNNKEADLILLRNAALELASKKHGVTKDNADKYIGTETNSNGVVIGYHVKGQTVMASRVPGHGPSSSGVFEVVEFDNSEGNQVMVPSEFNEIIGADNDGDALFIQMKGNGSYVDWNEAFDLITDYWLSKDMADQITTKMDFVEETDKVVKEVTKVFPQNDKYVMPFSPLQRMNDYNNTMVTKRSVGPVFNIHKIANLLSAYETSISKPIKIGNVSYDRFIDTVKGKNSRNQKSATLANIILDNTKYGYTTKLGINENNIEHATLMINLGIPLMDIGKILNTDAAKLWSEYQRSNASIFHKSKTKNKIITDIYKKLGVTRNKNVDLTLNMNEITNKSQVGPVLELMNYLSDMNSEINNISTIMSGHNKVHVNPIVLERQINDFKKTISPQNRNQMINYNEDMLSNPDLKNYLEVAEKTLQHLQKVNPIYRKSTNKVLQSLSDKIGQEMNIHQLEYISRDLLKFSASRLLSLNNLNKAYIEDLLNPNSPSNIYTKLATYLNNLDETQKSDGKDILNTVLGSENTLLFSKGLSMNLYGTAPYISANSEMVNESFNKVERERLQEEFEELPEELRNDLIVYDLIQHGWKGKLSMAPFFGGETNWVINYSSDQDLLNKNKDISSKVLDQLEKIMALKASLRHNNPFIKVFVEKKYNLKDPNQMSNEILKNFNAREAIKKGQPVYINVRSGRNTELYELQPFTSEDIRQVKSERTKAQQEQRILMIAKDKLKLVEKPENFNYDTAEIELSMIQDKNLGNPFKVYKNNRVDPTLDPMVEASIKYEEIMERIRNQAPGGNQKLDAREDYDDALFSSKNELTFEQYQQAMEFLPRVSEVKRKDAYRIYQKTKKQANKVAEELLPTLDSKSKDELLDMYNKYGQFDAYAYSIVMTPIIKKLANDLALEQSQLTKKESDGKDISAFQSYMMTGSTIPSNHPHSQALARNLEVEYKKFINEKKKYMSKLNELTHNLYVDKLNFTENKSILNTLKRIKLAAMPSNFNPYERLYGNLVIRKEFIDDMGRLQTDYRLKPKEEIEKQFNAGLISNAEKEFYDYFRETTETLKPKNLKTEEKDYIPHTSMSRLETFSSRGLLGLMVNSKKEDDAIYDVKIFHKDINGEKKLMSFKEVEDTYKINSTVPDYRNSYQKLSEYRAAKLKAKKYLKMNQNEDGSKIIYAPIEIETALGFGVMNRFANNRSSKSKEMPSLDLNKALGDYVHSTLFVNGNENFTGFEKLQGYIDGVLAWNRENNLPQMNKHIQTVWKDYFLRGKRQESVFGKKVDNVILGLTRMNLFYALGYQGYKNTGGLYVVGNILAGKYHNIKDVGGKAWLKGELMFWGLDKGFEGGIEGIIQRHKRMSNIMKNINFMDINIYDEVNMEKKNGLDSIFSDLALMPMIQSEKWIQQVHMLGLMEDWELDQFDEAGNYKQNSIPIDNERLVALEDQVKSSHGRGYQPTDQRAVQLYSWGTMMMQFNRFIPTMFHDRFAKRDVNIYGKETVGTLRAVSDMVRYVANHPTEYIAYRNSLSPEERKKLDSGLKGMAMASIISLAGTTFDKAGELFWDTNYYMNYPKLTSKMVPSPIQSINNLTGNLF